MMMMNSMDQQQALTMSTCISCLLYNPKFHQSQNLPSSQPFYERKSYINWEWENPTKCSKLILKARRRDTASMVVETPKLRRFQVSQGHPAPFGATLRDDGVNFAVYSCNAVSATLCLMSLSDLLEVFIL